MNQMLKAIATNSLLDAIQSCGHNVPVQLVPLIRNEVLNRPEIAPRYIYFPIDALVALVSTVENGDSLQVATIGSDSAIGLGSVVGIKPNLMALVVRPGDAYRVAVEVFKKNISTAAFSILFQNSQRLITEIAHNAYCAHEHTVDQRFARWLLAHCESTEMLVTQFEVSDLLGVRREGVTAAAGRLQSEGIIKYRRGRITILKRGALAAAACGCVQ